MFLWQLLGFREESGGMDEKAERYVKESVFN